MDRPHGGAILYGARVLTVASKFLGKIRSVSGSAGFETEEKHARLLLAYRSRERHSFLAKHPAERTLVFHCAPRARAWPLLRSLLASGGSLFVANWSGAWIP